MGYKLLGMVVWKGGRMLLRRKYGTWVPKPVIAGGLLVVVGIVLAAARSRAGDG